ncbi:BTAD domain-containing putative transcriptional regulator [Deinococcus aluminii]
MQLRLLGPPEVLVGDQPAHFRTRKALALLMYLAVEGQASRDVLADLLWEQRQEGRAALRNTLSHLRSALGSASPLLHSGANIVALDLHSVHSDVQELGRAEASQVLALWRGPFLGGLTVQGAPAWEEWVTAQATLRREQYDALLARHIREGVMGGEAQAALPLAHRRVQLNPLNEDAYALLVRTQLAAGLLDEARSTYAACRAVLQQELGVLPTFAAPPGVQVSFPEPPPVVGRPVRPGAPPLVGRAREWERLQDAWTAGKLVFLSGEAGSGKTRLAHDFLAGQGAYLCMEGRPTDAAVPFAVARRFLRQGLAGRSLSELPDAVRRELSRLDPTLSPTPLPPLRDAAERLRLFDLYVEFMGRVFPPHVMFLIEDLHFWDRDSHELGAYGAAYGPDRQVFVRSLSTYRPDELPPVLLESILPVVALGRAEIIDLAPLGVGDVHALLHHLDPRAPAALAQRLHRFTGGNPLFVLETARLLQEQGALTQAEGGELPRSRRVQEIIGRRLLRLPNLPRDVVRVAALAGPEFSLDLARRVLGVTDLEAAQAFEHLEQAGIFRGERLAHDLWAAVTADLMPCPTAGSCMAACWTR